MKRILFCVAASLSVVGAQSPIVVPGFATTVDGNAIDREPFGLESMRHITYMHRDSLNRIPTQSAINRIAYRRDAAVAIPVMRRSPGIWQVRMGDYRGSVMQPPSAWPSNPDPAWTLVFQPRQISFPDLVQPSGSGPAPFDLMFWFDRPFVYPGHGIGIEHYVADGSGRYDYLVDAVDGLVAGGHVSPLPGAEGCPAGFNRVAGQAPNPGGGNVELYLFGAPLLSPAVLALGGSSQNWAGLPLPVDLGVRGLSGCKISTSLDIFVPSATTSAGSAEMRIPVPGLPNLLGSVLFAQWLCPGDSRVSTRLPITFSDGVQVTLGRQLNSADLGISVVSANAGSNQHGYVQPNRGPVVQLSW